MKVYDIARAHLDDCLDKLEAVLDSDIITIYSPMQNGLESLIRDQVELLKKRTTSRKKVSIILTTSGGSATVVERLVNIFRYHYETIHFIVPDYAYSAGTIFCMSGDEIFMDYYSVLGPIDPQVQNKDGKWVPALLYLDKVNELLLKATNGSISQAEFLILKDFDLAELKAYEQQRDLTIDLLKKWLVNYKFRNWNTHSDGTEVTPKEKQERAEVIARELNDHHKWKIHGRPLNMDSLKELRLKINDIESNKTLAHMLKLYYAGLQDYISSKGFTIFIHTKEMF